MKDLLQKAEALVTDELPEGWQEVRDGNELYYWHIWTGTIQYERPVLSAVVQLFMFILDTLSIPATCHPKEYFEDTYKV